MNTEKDRLDYYPDHRGLLGVLSEIPFEPKRLFIIDNVPEGAVRGEHAHKQQQQLLICLRGKVAVLQQNNDSVCSIMMIQGDVLLIDRKVWAHQQYFDNASVLVLCSGEYDRLDYITDLDEFKDYLRNDRT